MKSSCWVPLLSVLIHNIYTTTAQNLSNKSDNITLLYTTNIDNVYKSKYDIFDDNITNYTSYKDTGIVNNRDVLYDGGGGSELEDISTDKLLINSIKRSTKEDNGVYWNIFQQSNTTNITTRFRISAITSNEANDTNHSEYTCILCCLLY